MSIPAPPARPVRPQPTDAAEGGTVGAGALIMLGGGLVALGGVLLGIGLGSAWVLLTGAISLPAGVVMGMLGLFGALSRSPNIRSSFNLLRLLGLLAGVG